MTGLGKEPEGPVLPGGTRGGQNVPAGRRKRRRRIAGGGGLVTAAVIAFFAIPGLRNNLPASVPLVGKDADSVWSQIRSSGLAVGEGGPASGEFRDLARNNSCSSSHTFVHTEGESGWAIICVKPPGGVYRSMRDAMYETPALMAPMWVDQNAGEVIIFGFGWPGRSSEQIADVIGDAEYITFTGS